MKLKLFIAALLMVGFSSCVERICPTYTKLEDPQPKELPQVVEKNSENM